MLGDAPANFPDFRIAATTRTPREILAHMGDLCDWALAEAQGEHRWRDSPTRSWPDEVVRFFDALEAFDRFLASDSPLGASAERLFQGPVADALTHTGQLALLRRAAGEPVRGENYARADIEAGRTGIVQPPPRVEFD